MEKEIYQTGKKRKNIRERGKKGRVEGWVLVEGYGWGGGGREGGSGCTGSPEQLARCEAEHSLLGGISDVSA